MADSSLRILLIEGATLSEDRLRRALAQACPTLPCQIVRPSDLEAALRQRGRGSVDVVFLPASIAVVPMEEALAALAEAYPGSTVVVFGVPANDAAMARTLAAGATDALAEDELDPLSLCRAVRRARALHQAQARLRASEALLRLFVQHTPAAVAMFDRQMRYLAVSDRWRHDYGLAQQRLLGRSHFEVFPETADHWREVLQRCLGGVEEQCDEDPLPRADGGLDWVRWEVRPWLDAEGEVGGVLLYTEDITDRKHVEEALRHLATHDHLTGLLNRSAFLDRLERCCERAAQSDHYSFSLLFLDLDQFKEINDNLGHAAGDELLQQIAARLLQVLRPKDALARFAGDEFVMLLEDAGREEAAVAAAERVLCSLEEPFQVFGHRLPVSGSMGVALSAADVAPLDLLRRADTAMYAAKENGKGGWAMAPR